MDLQLKLCKGISYAAVAAHADKSGRRKLAAMLVEHEPRSTKQVSIALDYKLSKLHNAVSVPSFFLFLFLGLLFFSLGRGGGWLCLFLDSIMYGREPFLCSQ